MTSPVRIGVAGVGRIGSMHAELLDRKIPGAELVAVADIDSEQAARVAGDLGVSVLTVEELISSPELDAVAICTSTDTHVALIVEAAHAGKAIFVEKPISLDLAEVDRALAAVTEAGVPFMVGFNRRFDPGHQYVHDVVASGEIGATHIVRITSRDPAPPPIAYIEVSGGIFLDMTIHDFDMARHVVGSPVVEVFAKGAVWIDPAFGDAGDVDTAIAMLTHANGTLTTIDNSRQAKYGYDQRLEVFGADGMVVSENPRAHAGFTATDSSIRGANLPYFFLERYTTSYLREWQAFIDYVREGGPSPVAGADARASVVIGLAALQSLREGRPIPVTDG